MSISLRDLKLAKAALLPECRLHAGHPSASCVVCHGLAAAQQDKQYRRQRESAHVAYLRRLAVCTAN